MKKSTFGLSEGVHLIFQFLGIISGACGMPAMSSYRNSTGELPVRCCYDIHVLLANPHNLGRQTSCGGHCGDLPVSGPENLVSIFVQILHLALWKYTSCQQSPAYPHGF
jgi:hypothetical protein